MNTFENLATSRREWIDNTLIPWCRRASRAELVKAEGEWTNLAGHVDPEATLWSWAWGRFPDLVYEGLPGVNETCAVAVQLKDGRRLTGYPDNRESRQGRLALLQDDGAIISLSIDDVEAAGRT